MIWILIDMERFYSGKVDLNFTLILEKRMIWKILRNVNKVGFSSILHEVTLTIPVTSAAVAIRIVTACIASEIKENSVGTYGT
jgi:peptidoglycan biosynthesis protein MviN/MurJ (putative lipid II flippase)